MNNMPPKLREEMAKDPFYEVCSRKMLLKDHECSGRITWEHVIIYAGKQLQKAWAIIPLCELAHSVNSHQDGGILDKDINRWIALNRATPEEIADVSKATSYNRMLDFYNKQYGVPDFSYTKRGQHEPSPLPPPLNQQDLEPEFPIPDSSDE